MDRHTALGLLERITGYWSMTLTAARTEAWLDMLGALDEGVAGTAFVRLKTKGTSAPSPADFMSTYSTLSASGGGAPSGPRCGGCHGTGWVTDTDHPRHWPGDSKDAPTSPDGECLCNVVTWCPRCADGQAAKDTLHRINLERGRHRR